MRFYTSVLSVVLVSLSGCAALPVDYCDLQPEARCSLEIKLEDQLNNALESIESPATVNVDFICADGAVCPATVSTSESGDFKRVDVKVVP